MWGKVLERRELCRSAWGVKSLVHTKTCAQDPILQGRAKNSTGAVTAWLPELRMC